MEQVSDCPICRCSNLARIGKLKARKVEVPATFDLQQCRHCGLEFLSPRPCASEMSQYYPRTYYKIKPVQPHLSPTKKTALAAWYGYPMPAGASSARLTLFKLLRPFLKDKVSGQIPDYVHNGTLLEIGCGRGDFLVKMRDLGWHVCGIDIGQAAIDFARQQHNLDTQVAQADKLPYDDCQFDVVFLSHVIEHLHQPHIALQEIYRVLKPEGKVLITTPNCSSLGNKLFGLNWLHYDPPRHMMIYNRQSLALLLKENGFNLQHCYAPATNSATVFRLSLVQRVGSKGLGRVMQRSSRWMEKGYFLLLWLLAQLGLPTGEEMQATAIKQAL